jgi:hypothetical protein
MANIVGSFISGAEAGKRKRLAGLQAAQYAEEAPLRKRERLAGLGLAESRLQHQKAVAPYQLQQAQMRQKMSSAQFDEFMDKRNMTNAAITASEFKTVPIESRPQWIEQKISESARKGNNTLTRQLIEIRDMSPADQEKAADSTIQLAQRWGILRPEPTEKPPRVSLTAGEYLVNGLPKTLKVSDRGFVDAVTGELVPEGAEVRKVRTGTVTTIDPKTGQVTIKEGVQLDGKTGATPAVRTKAQKKILESTELLGQLKRIEDLYTPEYLGVYRQAKEKWKKFKSKIGIGLSEEEKKERSKYVKFSRNTSNFLNQYLKSQSGVAISDREAKRLMKAMPTMNDDAVEYMAKFEEVRSDLERARLIYGLALKEQGKKRGTPEVEKRADQFTANVGSLSSEDIDTMGEHILSIHPEWQNLPESQQTDTVVEELRRLGFING